jgi:GntR family transcriptional regulator/MocR family aminotransferase
LRRAIADYLRASRGADCEPDQVFITGGTQDSLDLCARAFADPGDKAWIENPGYGGAWTAFRAAQLKVIGIPLDADGVVPQARDWQRHRPRLIYTTPSHQYPTGSVLSLERRIALIEQARAAGALIIEDDYDSEFRHDGPPLAAMQGLAPDAPVLYLGTFSKTMFPALRIGFMVVPRALAPPLRTLLAVPAPRGRTVEQRALAEFLRSGQFAMHLRRMRRLYRERRDALVAALERHVGTVATVHGGSAGMHLALQFNDPRLIDTDIAAQALEQGIVARAERACDWRAGKRLEWFAARLRPGSGSRGRCSGREAGRAGAARAARGEEVAALAQKVTVARAPRAHALRMRPRGVKRGATLRSLTGRRRAPAAACRGAIAPA